MAPRSTDCDPPSMVSVVPLERNGDFVMMCITPFAEFGPNSAEAGPFRISTRSMSSLVPDIRNGTFTRSDGTPANR